MAHSSFFYLSGVANERALSPRYPLALVCHPIPFNSMAEPPKPVGMEERLLLSPTQARLSGPPAGSTRANGTLAGLLQHGTPTLIVGLQTSGTRGMAHKEHGVWRSGKRVAFSTSPHPRRRRDRFTTRCATLTISLVQITGQATVIPGPQARDQGHRQLNKMPLRLWPPAAACWPAAAGSQSEQMPEMSTSLCKLMA